MRKHIAYSSGLIDRTFKLDAIKMLKILILAIGDSKITGALNALLEVAPLGTNFEYIACLGMYCRTFDNTFKTSNTSLKEMLCFKHTTEEYKVILTKSQIAIYNSLIPYSTKCLS